MEGAMVQEDIQDSDKAMAAGQATESEFNTQAGAEDFIHTTQAKAAIPEKEGLIRAATCQVTGKAVTGAKTGAAIRGEISYTKLKNFYFEDWVLAL